MDEIERLQKELVAMPEWDRVWSVREFQSTVWIFKTNAAETLTFLRNRALQDTKRDPLETSAFQDLQQELARLVHNFVAAASTLVDHARVFFTDHGASDLFAAYDQEVDRRFRKGGLHNFVKGLRNFILHQRFPAITSMRTWSSGSEEILHMHFWQKSDFVKWSRWTPEARTFLERAADQINIQHVVSDYESLIGSFYDWVFDKLKEFHQNDERLVAEKQQQIDELVRAAATS